MRKVRLGDYTTKIGSGATPRGGLAVYQTEGVALIRSQNVHDSIMRHASVARISNQAADSLSGVEVRSGDVLINITGESVARCALVDPAVLPARVNQHVMIIRTDERLDPRFLQRVLVSPEMKTQLLSESDGGTRRALTKSQISNLEVPLPELRIQRAIAEVLGALDDKIAADLRASELAAELAQTLFERASSGALHQADLASFVSTQYGLTTAASKEPGPRLIRVTDINKKPWIEWSGAPKCQPDALELDRYILRQGDILVARMADPGKTAIVGRSTPPSVFASYLVRLVAKREVDRLWIYHFLRSPAYIEYAEGAMTGSVQKNMNARVIVATQLPVPYDQVLQDFNEVVQPIHDMLDHRYWAMRRLTELRDTLLPQLMSGAIRVRDAEVVVSQVV